MAFKMKPPTFFSEKGYKRNSPDVNNKVNTIKSGDITMKGVDFPVKGEDNLGNLKLMKPGKDYKFPGESTDLKSKIIFSEKIISSDKIISLSLFN